MSKELKESANEYLVRCIFQQIEKALSIKSTKDILSMLEEAKPLLEKHLSVTWTKLSEL